MMISYFKIMATRIGGYFWIIVLILWLSNYIIIVGTCQLENYQIIGTENSQEVSHPNEIYKDKNGNEWTTYTMRTSGTLSIRILQDGKFKFAWKMDKLGDKNKLYFNRESYTNSDVFNETDYFNVKQNDILKWTFSVTDKNGGQVWIAFPYSKLNESTKGSLQLAGTNVTVNATIIPKKNMKPIIVCMTSNKTSPQETGSTVAWTVNATDAENDSILYRFFLNGQPATKWQLQNRWNWSISKANESVNQIEVRIIDQKHSDKESYDDKKNQSFEAAILVDDGSSIIDALNRAKRNRVSTIYINSGNYYLNETLYINTYHINLIGKSKEVILHPLKKDLNGIRISMDDCVIKNITLAGFNDGIQLKASDCLIENVSISSNKTAIQIESSSRNITLKNNTLRGTNGFYILSAKDSSLIDIVGSTIFHNNCAVLLDGISNSIVNGNNISSLRLALQITNSVNITVHNNKIDAGYPGYLGNSICIMGTGCKGITINNNTIKGNPCDDSKDNNNNWTGNCWQAHPCDIGPKFIYRSNGDTNSGINDSRPLCCEWR